MIKLRETVRVARDSPTCYRYLVDFSTCEQWDPGVYRAVKRTPGVPAVGSLFDVTVSVFGRHTTLSYRIDRLEPDVVIELSARGAGLCSDERIELHAVDSRTTDIVYSADFKLGGALRATQPLTRPLFKRMGRAAVAGLKHALEIDDQPPRQGWLSHAADHSVVAALPGFTERGYLALSNKAHSQYMDDRVVVVTGATRGIGRAIAAEYARLGARLALVGRDSERLDQAADYVRDFAGSQAARIACFTADLSRVAQVQAVARRIAEAYPRIDVLVNNAGALFDDHEMTDDGLERTVAINLMAPFVLTETLLASLVAANGHVINMSSGGMYLQPLKLDDMNYQQEAFDGTKAYARTKRGLVALTRHWARRYSQLGVRFNAMHPGWVATPGVSDALPRFNRVLGGVLRDARMGADTAVWLGSASAAQAFNGAFFADRAPHPTAVLPNTQVRPSDAQSLYGWLRNETGIDTHGFG